MMNVISSICRRFKRRNHYDCRHQNDTSIMIPHDAVLVHSNTAANAFNDIIMF